MGPDQHQGLEPVILPDDVIENTDTQRHVITYYSIIMRVSYIPLLYIYVCNSQGLLVPSCEPQVRLAVASRHRTHELLVIRLVDQFQILHVKSRRLSYRVIADHTTRRIPCEAAYDTHVVAVITDLCHHTYAICGGLSRNCRPARRGTKLHDAMVHPMCRERRVRARQGKQVSALDVNLQHRHMPHADEII